MDKDVQPRVADSSVPFRAIAKRIPCVCDSADFSHVLPAARGGANAVFELDVTLLGGLFSKSSRFFDDICQVPQADEDALFKHPVVKAGVQVKWEHARSRFLLIFGWYVLFVTLFTCWSIAEPLVDVGKIGPRPLSVVTLASMLPLLFVEVKQAYKVGLRSHLVSLWNVIAALVLGSISVSIVLSETTNVAAASVIRVIHWYCFAESGSNE